MYGTRTYILDGLELRVPLLSGGPDRKPIEDYREWIENPVFTPAGRPVMFSGTDACLHGEEAAPGGCPDCGSCRFYQRAAEHTWIGICLHQENRREPPPNKSGETI